MTKRQDFPATLAIPMVAALIVKCCLLGWNHGEYTDGILQLTLFDHDVPYFPPLYTLCSIGLIRLGLDGLIAGKMVSILASTLTVLPLYALAQRVFPQRQSIAVWTVWIYLVSPIANRWGIRVMTDSLFSFLFLMAFWQWFEAACARGSGWIRSLGWSIFWSGLASLTRYHGMIFLPLYLYWFWMRSHSESTESNVTNRPGLWRWPGFVLAFLPWFGLLYWVLTRGTGHGGQFASRFSVVGYAVYLEGWLLYLPWGLTYPLTLLAIAFAIRWIRMEGPTGLFARTSVSLLVVWWLVQTAFQSFQFRYWLPLVPLVCLMGAVTLHELCENRTPSRFGHWILAVTLLWGFLLSAAVLTLQRDTWANIRATGLYASELPDDVRVWGDEVYGSTAYNPQLQYYAGRVILPLSEASRLGGLKNGDVVLLHPGAYSPEEYKVPPPNYLGPPRGHLAFQYDLERETHVKFDVERLAYFYFHTWPLLPDIMSFPPGATSQPAALAYRHAMQDHWGLVVKLHQGSGTP